ncbi:MAG: hypothetical protein OHK0045_10270 [Raineya sp.]
MYRWIFIILLSSLCLESWAQKDTLLPPLKTTKPTKKVFFSKDSMAYRVGLDMLGLGQTFFRPKFALHINTDIALRNKNLLVLEYTWARREEKQVAFYQSQGSIVRAGWLHNFLYKQSKEDVFGIGFRLANAWFREKIEASIQNPIFGSEPVFFQQNLQATWVELNMELKARVWKNLITGYCLRYQFRAAIRGEELFSPYGIPSVGRVGRNNWGFQYGLWYRF